MLAGHEKGCKDKTGIALRIFYPLTGRSHDQVKYLEGTHTLVCLGQSLVYTHYLSIMINYKHPPLLLKVF